MKIKSQNTSIKRKKPSRPLAWALQFERFDLLQGSVLDFGCGKGDDVRHLRALKPTAVIHGYDPNLEFPAIMPRPTLRPYLTKSLHYPPIRPPYGKSRTYDTVMLTYVLNVLPYQERRTVLRQAWDMVAPGGHLVVSTRSKRHIERLASRKNWRRHLDGFISSEKRQTFQVGLDSSEIRELSNGLFLDSIRHWSRKDSMTVVVYQK